MYGLSRALIAGGLEADRISRVVGLAASVPFDKQHPADPVNRRISIIVMSDQAAQAARSMADGGDAATPSALQASIRGPTTASAAALASSRLPLPSVIVHATAVATGAGAAQPPGKPASP